MTLAGGILILITIISSFLIVAVAPYIKIVTNNYFFWLALGLLLLVYLITFRFADEWKQFGTGMWTSIVISRAFMLDMCPFSAFFICVLITVDPTRKLASILAPFAIFGGLITIVGGYAFNGDNGEPPQLDWHYVLIGTPDNPIYFMMHYINVVIGMAVLVSTPKLGFQRYVMGNVFAILYFSYVGIMVAIFHVTDHATGMVPGDWANDGEYAAVSEILHLGYPGCMILGLLGAYLAIVLIIFLGALLQKSKRYRWYNVRNQKWYKGWYKLQLNKQDLKKFNQQEKVFNLRETLQFWKHRI